MSATFPARFDGKCAAGCDMRIHPGDLVRYEDDQLVHDTCAPKPDPLELRPTDVVCPDCWCIRPCRCLD